MELMSYINVNELSFGYTEKNILKDINFTIKKGEITSILGPNGSGKSTLIRLMLGFLNPFEGSIQIEGKDISDIGFKELARKIAYVPQIHKTAFPYTVVDVVLMGRIPHKSFFFKYSKGDQHIAYEAMERLSILHLAEKPYTDISGGERQLTIIARAIAQGASTLIMDEPAGGLDYGNQLKLLEEIVKLSKEGYTFIKSTHSPEHALWISDRVIMIKNCCVFADGKPKDVISNENLYMLYGAKVDIVKINEHIKTCVPQKFITSLNQ
jgi:iron complex transport system ATP-binding protein